MNKRIKILLLSGGVAVVLMFSVAATNDFQAGKAIEIFYNVLRTINLEYVDPVDNEKLLRKATDQMLSTLDPYTVYLDAKDMEVFKIATTGKYGGVGSLVKRAKDSTGYASISSIYEGFPMHVAGVTPGDTIIAIDGVSMKGLKIEEITSRMKGSPGTIVNMKMRKLRTGKDITYPVKREVVRISPLDYYGFINDSIGYISFNTFSADGSKDVRRAVSELKATGKLKGLILDLRENGGGLVNEAVDIVGLFTPKGTPAVSMKGRNGKDNRNYLTTVEPIDTKLPLAVIINSRSASASEIVAGALQDHDRAYIVGERSFGKGLVQSPRPVGFDSYVKVTIAKYYTPSGRCIQALDYTHRKDDGSVGHIPDSLISEFKSSNGRILYDGGGVMPDSVIMPDEISIFTASVIDRGYVDDFATLYYKKHSTVASVEKFHLTDKDYADFVSLVKDKEIEYKSKSEDLVEQLRKSAEKEKIIGNISADLERLEKTLKSRDNEKSLREYKAELIEVLEMDIMLKYYFNTGRTHKMVLGDGLIKKTATILGDQKHYTTVLKSKSPRKN